MPAVEPDAVAAMMVRLGDWMLAQGGRVQSVDANPVLVARGAGAGHRRCGGGRGRRASGVLGGGMSGAPHPIHRVLVANRAPWPHA